MLTNSMANTADKVCTTSRYPQHTTNLPSKRAQHVAPTVEAALYCDFFKDDRIAALNCQRCTTAAA